MNKIKVKTKNIILNQQKGFALLFTVVIISAVSVITAGLTSTIYKQAILSSLAKDSQQAFYEADTASDCALYADIMQVSSSSDSTFLAEHSSLPWSCGGMNLIATITDELGSYTLMPKFDDEEDEDNPCFKIEVVNTLDENGKIVTSIKARGYNICDSTNSRAVEREIETDYTRY